MKYRKKPEYVEAVQFWNTREGKAALCELGLQKVTIRECPKWTMLRFDCLFGECSCMEGDYVIKDGITFGVMSRGDFERTYEIADD